jgi:hypothetical protein
MSTYSALLNTPTFEAYVEQVRRDGLVIFAGAGISVAPPSGAPTWKQLIRELLSNMMDILLENDWPIKESLRKWKLDLLQIPLRPETTLWSLAQIMPREDIENILAGIDEGAPNGGHLAVATLAKAGIVKAIITTNFDQHFERACISLKVPFHVIRDDEECRALGVQLPDGLHIYKPHGCLSRSSSLRFMIDEIQTLADASRTTLKMLIASAPAMILGYSGNDEDIFPVLTTDLESSSHPCWVVIWPGSSADEPLRKWVSSPDSHIFWSLSTAEETLSQLQCTLSPTAVGEPHSANNAVSDETKWKKPISMVVRRTNLDVVTVALAQLCSVGGAHHLSDRLATLAQDIVEDTKLSKTPDQTMHLVREIRSKACQEWGDPHSAEVDHRQNVAAAASQQNLPELIRALFGQIHAKLRENKLASAEGDLDTLASLLGHAHKDVFEAATRASASAQVVVPSEFVHYVWYRAILLRKQGKAETALPYFAYAVRMFSANGQMLDIARTYLDMGFAFFQLRRSEEASQAWKLAAEIAEQANDWSTAGKAAKNLGQLYASGRSFEASDKELHRAIEYFSRANDMEAMQRTEALLQASPEERYLASFLLGISVPH